MTKLNTTKTQTTNHESVASDDARSGKEGRAGLL